MFFLANKLFTIGQFARMHQINKTTLMWYDKIGLLKPSTNRKNGYRYYTYRQSYILEIIITLRELDVPIYKIKKFLEERTPSHLEELFTAEILEVDERISRLMAIRERISQSKEKVSLLNRINLNEIQIVNKEKQHLITVEASQEDRFEAIIDKIMSTVERHQLERSSEYVFGSMISVNNLYSNQFKDYDAYYIKLPFQFSTHKTSVQPEGKYLRAYCKGWDNLEKRYIEILSYAREHGLKLENFSYEEGINEFFIDTFDDYITQIEIPIKMP